MPDFAAIDSPSRLTHVVVNAIRLFTSFIVLPRPERAEVHERAPERLEHRLHARATASSSPPTMNESMRFWAPIAPPVSGASTRW